MAVGICTCCDLYQGLVLMGEAQTPNIPLLGCGQAGGAPLTPVPAEPEGGCISLGCSTRPHTCDFLPRCPRPSTRNGGGKRVLPVLPSQWAVQGVTAHTLGLSSHLALQPLCGALLSSPLSCRELALPAETLAPAHCLGAVSLSPDQASSSKSSLNTDH